MAENITEEIYTHICNAILEGKYPSGSRLPSSNDLSSNYKTASQTALKALRKAASAGYAQKVRGVGYIVANNAAERIKSERIEKLEQTVKAMLREGALIGISKADIIEMCRRSSICDGTD